MLKSAHIFSNQYIYMEPKSQKTKKQYVNVKSLNIVKSSRKTKKKRKNKMKNVTKKIMNMIWIHH